MAHPLPLRTDLDGGCVDCGKPGRPRRAPRGGESLTVCDVHAQLLDLDAATDDYVPVHEDANPVADYRDLAEVFLDELGLWDRLLTASGIRWHLLRHIPRTVRQELYQETIRREYHAMPGTRPASEGGTVWQDHVDRLIDAEHWQARKAEKWRRFARMIADSVDPVGPPITREGVTMPELCAALGCSERYVQQIQKWFRDRGLLLVLVRGTRAPRMEAPEDERPEEAAAREAREEARAAANRQRIAEARAHVQAEIAAHAAGRPAPPPPDSFAPFREMQQQLAEEPPAPLINIAQVYQLRLPVAPDARDAPRESYLATLAAKRRQRRAQAQADALEALALETSRRGWNREYAEVPNSKEKSSVPPCLEDRESLQAGGAGVEERPASRGSYDEGSCPSGGSNQPRRREPRHVRAARRLLGRLQSAQGTPVKPLLPDHLCREVTLSALAGWIRQHVVAGWSDDELVLAIAHDGGRWHRAPDVVRNAPGFVRTALTRWPADGTRPTIVDFELRRRVDELDHENDQERVARAARGRRIAIDACSRCDEEGWELLDGGGPEVRCDHRPVAQDQAAAAAAAAAAERLTSTEARDQARDVLCARGAVTALRSRLLAEAEANRSGEQDQGESGTGYRSKRARKKWGK
ncbi:MAG: hypothetical protein K0Q93_2166 [Nocardioidaceae bacterium]|jgi:hypothetical protein|nr:hypothetical protein [Nocardioidaceae bacterium]